MKWYTANQVLTPPPNLTAAAMVGVPSGVPGADAAELTEAEVVVGEAERAIIFWRTSLILSCRHTLVGKASECFAWNVDVACGSGRRVRQSPDFICLYKLYS